MRKGKLFEHVYYNIFLEMIKNYKLNVMYDINLIMYFIYFIKNSMAIYL